MLASSERKFFRNILATRLKHINPINLQATHIHSTHHPDTRHRTAYRRRDSDRYRPDPSMLCLRHHRVHYGLRPAGISLTIYPSQGNASCKIIPEWHLKEKNRCVVLTELRTYFLLLYQFHGAFCCQ